MAGRPALHHAVLAFAAAALSDMMHLSGHVMAFIAAEFFSLLAYDLVRVIAYDLVRVIACGC